MKADPFLAPNYGRDLSKPEWRHVFEQLALRVTGESMMERHRIPTGTRFTGVMHALSEYADRIEGGFRVSPSMDPERMRTHDAKCGTHSRSEYPGPGIDQVDYLYTVRRALDWAYETTPEPLYYLQPSDCRAVAVLRYGCGFSVYDIAEQIAAKRFDFPDPGVTKDGEPKSCPRTKHVRKDVMNIARWGHVRMWEKLFEAGLVPRPDSPCLPEEELVELEGYDLQGLKAIADHLGGVSTETVRRYISQRGLPVHSRFNRVYARRVELSAWMKSIDQQTA